MFTVGEDSYLRIWTKSGEMKAMMNLTKSEAIEWNLSINTF